MGRRGGIQAHRVDDTSEAPRVSGAHNAVSTTGVLFGEDTPIAERVVALEGELDMFRSVFAVVFASVVVSCTGPAGPAGAEGPAGPAGPRGPAGADGVPGAMGERGPQGAEGPQGMQGAQGMQGLQGAQGMQGPQGVQGPPGPAGPTLYKSFASKDIGINWLGSNTNVLGTFTLPTGKWWLRFQATGRVDLPLVADGTSMVADQVIVTCWLEAPNIYIGGLATATSHTSSTGAPTWTPVIASGLTEVTTATNFTIRCEPWSVIGTARALGANQVEVRDGLVMAFSAGTLTPM